MKKLRVAWLIIPILFVLWDSAVWGANADAIWVDEWWTTYYIGANAPVENNTISDIIQRVAVNRIHENNPVGYYVLLSRWALLVGDTDVALRLFSAFCSLLTVVLTYRLGRVIGGQRVGIITAFILAFSAFFVNYSHELRMYTLACMWAALGLLAYWEFIHRPQASWFWGAMLLLSAVGLVYTHYGNAVMIGLLGLFHLFVPLSDTTKTKRWFGKPRRWWQASFIALGAGVLFLPHLPLTLGISYRFSAKLVTTDPIDAAWTLWDVLRMTLMGFANEQILFLIIFGGAVLLFIRSLPRSQQLEGLKFSAMLSIGGILALLLMRLAFQTVFHVRYLLVLWLPTSLWVALVMTAVVQRLHRTAQRTLTLMLVLAWAGSGILLSRDIGFHANYVHPNVRPLFTELDRWDMLGQELTVSVHPQDAVMVSLGNSGAVWAHQGDATYYLNDLSARHILLEDEQITPDQFDDFIHGASRVWLARSTTWVISAAYQSAEAVLAAQGYQPCGAPQMIGNIQVTIYSAVPNCCTPPTQTLAHFGDYAELGTYAADRQDSQLTLWVGWLVQPTTPPKTYQVGVYTLDESGAVSSQKDVGLPAAGYSCLLLEFDIPTDAEQLYVAVYDWANGTRLPLLPSDNQFGGNLLSLPLTP